MPRGVCIQIGHS